MDLRIRILTPEDIPKLKEIHSCFFAEEFEFPNFHKNFICAFVITDENGKIISGGGVRYTVEATFVTDKSFSVKERRAALYKALESCEYITKRNGFDKLHSITEDKNWQKHLAGVGFHLRGNCLVLDL